MIESVDFTVYGYGFQSRYCRTFEVDRRWSVCHLRLRPSVPVPPGSDDAVAALLYSVDASAGHCIASTFNCTGLHALPLRLCRKVTISDPFQFALRRCSVRLVGCQRRHPRVRSSIFTERFGFGHLCIPAAMACRAGTTLCPAPIYVRVHGYRFHPSLGYFSLVGLCVDAFRSRLCRRWRW